MMAFVVTRFVCPAVTVDSHERERTKPVVPTPVSHTEKSSPTLSVHGRKLTKKQPNTFGIMYKTPTYAMLLGMRAARVTPVQIVTISTTPSTQPRSVVWRGVKPNEETMIWRWLVRELGILSRAENKANIHVFGSVRASIILDEALR